MKISEIFYSIQGEGPNAGKPAVFLRLALCNLHCSWCDTKYTWDWEKYDYKKEVKELSPETIEQQILQYDCKHLVLTGGEPLLQQKTLVPLLKTLQTKGFYIEVETNGTISPNDDILPLVNQWNVSPKLSNSDNSIEARECSHCYHLFNSIPQSYFKFVIDGEKDLREVKALISKYAIERKKVILMPQATDATELIEKSKWLSELCRKENVGFSTRLHVLIWGNQRAK